MGQDRKNFSGQWKKVRKEYPEVAKLLVAQQLILMQAAQANDNWVKLSMCKLIQAGMIMPFADYWQTLCSSTITRGVLEGTLACLTGAKDPSDCLTINHEDEWFDDPFVNRHFMPENPPIPPLTSRKT